VTKTTYKGKFLDWKPEYIDDALYAMLARIGERSVEAMRRYTRPHDWKGRLTDSIMWTTQRGHSEIAKEEDSLLVPDRPFQVDTGSGVYYAFFRENGAGPHLSWEGHEEFIDNMKEWFKEKLGRDPDDGGEDEWIFINILRGIRRGQDAVPFCRPALPAILMIIEEELRRFRFKESLR
jgi:hypothetical protein